MRVAVVDVGTNSVRLLIADRRGTRLVEAVRDLQITRLGENVDRTHALGDGPRARTVRAVAEFVRRARAAGADAIRVIATSAVRDAGNRDAFLDAVRAESDVVPEVLSGEDEARLGFLGATMEIPAPAPYLVVDIGGGSTEFVRGSHVADRFISVDMGSVRLTERHIRSDPPSAEMIRAVRADADACIDEA
ncbi:MAG TPA: exopolyphosphatase, partial [Actinomycetota bacterium]|nr:exopolyphosphatase [Actinomycetota bacterium]